MFEIPPGLSGGISYFCPVFQIQTPMIVYVNDTPTKTYYGAKVKSAVMAYFRDHNIAPKTPIKEVRDAYGNLIALDGSIRANSKIYFKL